MSCGAAFDLGEGDFCCFHGRMGMRRRGTRSRIGLISLYSPKSLASEAYRMLRTNVHFSSGGESIRVLEVTSSFLGEGKSLTACNLAITFAQAGESVVLIDADMRRPTVHEKFELPQSPGLSETIVTGKHGDFLKDGPVEGLRIITAGTIPPNPSELLHSDRMIKFLDDMKSIANLVIIDARRCWLSLMPVLRRGGWCDFGGQYAEVDKRCQARCGALQAVNAKVTGTVIRGVAPPKGKMATSTITMIITIITTRATAH